MLRKGNIGQVLRTSQPKFNEIVGGLCCEDAALDEGLGASCIDATFDHALEKDGSLDTQVRQRCLV